MTANVDTDVTLVRNATLLASVGETTFLVDPLFASQGALPPIDDTPNDRANPLVPMPDVDLSHDAVIVTHRHPDHFDHCLLSREELRSKTEDVLVPEDGEEIEL